MDYRSLTCISHAAITIHLPLLSLLSVFVKSHITFNEIIITILIVIIINISDRVYHLRFVPRFMCHEKLNKNDACKK